MQSELYDTSDSGHWEWKTQDKVDEIFEELTAANVNVIKLSVWGSID